MFNSAALPTRFVLDHTSDPVGQTVAYLREQIATRAWAPGKRLTRTGTGAPVAGTAGGGVDVISTAGG